MTKSYICGTGAMKKKAKKKSGKKSTKESKKASQNKELDPAQVLKEISAMIKQEAPEIAKAVIGEGKKGQLSPAKYLFEMAHIFPQDGMTPTEREESLAETLLDRLNIPKTPVVHDEVQKEEDEDVMVMQPVKESGETSDKDECEEKGEVVVAQGV